MHTEKQQKHTPSRIFQQPEKGSVQQFQFADNRNSTMRNFIASCFSVSQLYSEFTDAGVAKSEFNKSFILETHFDDIDSRCRVNEYVLSVREAGADSIKRLQEGARPKPHFILDKSIKGDRLKDQLKKRWSRCRECCGCGI